MGPIDDLSKNSTPRVRSNSNLVGAIDNLSKIQPHEKEKLLYRAKENRCILYYYGANLYILVLK